MNVSISNQAYSSTVGASNSLKNLLVSEGEKLVSNLKNNIITYLFL